MQNEFLELRKKIILKDFKKMNERQKQAVFCTEGPLLILAGAGSGKTTVIVNRIYNLIKYGQAFNSDDVFYGITQRDIENMKEYLDGDDEITPDCIEKLVAPILRDESIEMVMGGVARYDTRNSVPKKILDKDYTSNAAVRDYFFSKKGFYVGAWNKLIKKDFLVKNHLFFTEGLLYEDQLWTFLMVKCLSHLYRISDITYFYYMRPNSIITGTDKKELVLHWARVYENIVNNFTPGERGREAKHYTRGLCVRHAEHPGCSELHEVAERYLNELTEIRYLPEFILLKSTIVLSKYPIGREFLRQIANVVRLSLRKKKCKFAILYEKTFVYWSFGLLGI